MAVESMRGFLIMAVGFRMEMHYKQVRTVVYWGVLCVTILRVTKEGTVSIVCVRYNLACFF